MRTPLFLVALGAAGLTFLLNCSAVGGRDSVGDIAERRQPIDGVGGFLPQAEQVPREALRVGNPDATAGPMRIDLVVKGDSRHFFVYAPDDRPAAPATLILLHGGRGSAKRFIGAVPVFDHADRQGFLAVYPDGNRNWNDGRSAFEGRNDDVAFMRAIVDWLADNLGADRDKVFFTGISNGGSMAHKIACDAPDIAAGIAPVSAEMYITQNRDCRPDQATPMVVIQGTAPPPGLRVGGMEDVMETEDTLDFWAELAGCDSRRARDLPDLDPNDGSTVTRFDYDCSDGDIVYYRINDGGHTWPGRDDPQNARLADLVGSTNRDIDAIDAMLDFFGRHGL